MSQPPWSPNFDFYFVTTGGDPASISVDLGAAPVVPVRGHDHRLSLRIPMKHPRPDGLRSDEEFHALAALEDRLVENVAYAVDGWLVGRVLHRGVTELVFYLPKPSPDDEAQLEQAITAFASGYDITRQLVRDAKWEFYGSSLWPDPHSLQRMSNRKLLAQLAEAGDDPAAIRTIDHFVYFDDAGTCKRMATKLAERGFAVDAPAKTEEGAWGLQFHRDDRLADGRIDEVTGEILEILGDAEAAYDGWGCPVSRS